MSRRDEWTEYELQLLYEVVNRIDWYTLVVGDLPDRSEGAIRHKMSSLRLESGIVPTKIGPRSKSRQAALKDDCAIASDRLRDAMLRLKAAERALDRVA